MATTGTTTTTLTPAAVTTEIGVALVTAVRGLSVAAQVTATHPTSHKSLTFPVIGTDLVAANIGEGEAIDLTNIGTGEVRITPTKQVAATRITNEALADAFADSGEAALTILTGSINAALAAKVDRNMVDALAALTGHTDGGSTTLADLDAFHAALASIRTVGATPTAILVSPATVLRLSTMKEGTASKRSLLQPTAQDPAVLAVAGVPFVESRFVGDDVAYAVAADRLALVMRTQATVEVDRSVFALTRESLVLGEVRTGFGVLQPAAVVKVSIAPAA